MSFDDEFYYWDTLTEKFNISTESGHKRATKALSSWYSRNHNASLISFDVVILEGNPTEAEIELEIDASVIGVPVGLNMIELEEYIENDPDCDVINERCYSYISKLVKETLVSSWSIAPRGDKIALFFWLK